jgi:sterol desaturase/sphingolipid hydroxylase (fatty acid hydroxylase superfamily)
MLGNRLHAFTYLMFIVHKIFVTCETHSGFDIPWTPMVLLPFSNPSTHHDFHHSNNVGTYGGFTYLWDHLTGNNLEYYKSTFKYI